MKLAIIASVVVLIFVGGLAVYFGLGKSDAERARETAQAFMRGMNANDKEATLATLTAEAREKMREKMPRQAGMAKNRSAQTTQSGRQRLTLTARLSR